MDELEVEKARKDALKKKTQKRALKRRKWVFIRDILGIAYWRLRFRHRYKDYAPTWDELKRDLNTPTKAFAWFSEFIDIQDHKHQGDEIDSPNDVLRKGKASMKTVAYLYANLLHQYGYETYVFWIGYTGDYMFPVCAVKGKVYTLGLSSTYRVHWGDQFDIMRDYLKDGTTWKVMDRSGSRLIMSYIYGRSNYGSPDVIIYDETYWGENQPIAYELASKLRLAKKGTEPRPEVG